MNQGINPIYFFIIPLILVTVGYLIAFTKKGKVATVRMGSRVTDVRVPMDPDSVFRKLQGIGGLYKVDDADPQQHILVLSSGVTLFSWGFLYPVFIRREGSGSVIQVGIQSKFIQWGPIVGRAHRDVVTRIEKVLSIAPQERIA